jgi:hypothetical protein
MTQGDPAFEPVFQRLRGMLEPYARKMHTSADSEGLYGVDMAPEDERNPTTWFAGVRRGKQYVSYYFMPVYVDPALLDDVSAGLKKRMQGKSCFNFRSIDEELFGELEALTKRGYERTGGDPAWGVAQREHHEMAYRKAMSGRRNSRGKD